MACKNEYVATVDTDQNLNIWSLKTHQVTLIITINYYKFYNFGSKFSLNFVFNSNSGKTRNEPFCF